MRIDFHYFSAACAVGAVALGLLASCSTAEKEPFQVRQFHLSSVKATDDSAQMIRGEQLYRLRGAVTMEERTSRLGHYYTVYWNDIQNTGDAKVVFEYQQATTASKVLTMTREIPAGLNSGSVEFRVIGDSYKQGGRVLAWRARLISNGKVLAMKRSYLWR
ncbi:hypothetical protein NT6N_02230 [Oceaniferula spumae]|uniref:DUF1425 domain-containing protein n=1 Tax=Oceaniferula spumae TaxID=2979115 RepID=A0AAT9FGU7_9BACT